MAAGAKSAGKCQCELCTARQGPGARCVCRMWVTQPGASRCTWASTPGWCKGLRTSPSSFTGMGDREPPAKLSRDLAPRQHPCVCVFQRGRVDTVHQLQTPSAENVSAALGAERSNGGAGSCCAGNYSLTTRCNLAVGLRAPQHGPGAGAGAV